MQERDSSNNSNADEYFDIGVKKVDIIGNISDSASESHSSQSNYKGSKSKRNNYSKQISNLLKQEENQSGQEDSKTKIIKKNCVSAKMSRQRKKIYIDLLEKKVGSLKRNIINTREKLAGNRSKIMHYIQQSNKQKRVYIEQKMKDSKRLIYMSEEFSSLSSTAKSLQGERKKSQMGSVVYIPQHESDNWQNSKPQNLQPKQIPPQMQIPKSISNHNPNRIQSQLSMQKGANMTAQRKSKKSLKMKPQAEAEMVYKQLQEKKQLLQLGINSYLYKFGINGILKNDVVELLKQKWYQLVIDQTILDAGKSTALQKVICDFRDCFWQIDESNKKLDYLLRQLRDKIKPQYVVKFILQKEFFKSFSANQIPQEQNVNMSEQKIQYEDDMKEDRENQDAISNPQIRQLNQMSESFPYAPDKMKRPSKIQEEQLFQGQFSKQKSLQDSQFGIKF